MSESALTCKCGDCGHWEIVADAAGNQRLRCVTCKAEYDCDIAVESDEPQFKETT